MHEHDLVLWTDSYLIGDGAEGHTSSSEVKEKTQYGELPEDQKFGHTEALRSGVEMTLRFKALRKSAE